MSTQDKVDIAMLVLTVVLLLAVFGLRSLLFA